jgi:hypothetical protein
VSSNFFKLQLVAFLTMLAGATSAFAGVEFIHFKSWDEASAYYEKLAPLVASIEGGQVHHVVPRAKAPYARLEEIVKTVSAGYAKYFPSVVPNGQPPYVLIVDNDEPNAFAMRDFTSDKNPYVFVVNTGEVAASDTAIRGTIAHELTHLFLQYESNGENVPAYRYYLARGNNIDFGPTIKNDANVEAAVKNIFMAYDEAGPFSNPELGNVPFSYDGSLSSNAVMLVYILKAAQSNPRCAPAVKAYGAMAKTVISLLNPETRRLELTTENEKNVLATLSSRFEAAAHTCFAGFRSNYDDLATGAMGIPKDVFDRMKQQLPQDQRAQYDKMQQQFATSDAIDVIFSAAHDGRVEMQKIEGATDLNRVRIFTAEDDADEMGIYILTQLNLNPNSLNEALTGILQAVGAPSCDPKAEPSIYGSLEDIHHDTCWRMYRNAKYADYLAKMSPSARDNLYRDRSHLARPALLSAAFRL